ncbi:hypothetical protein PF005_g14828 [Phytophthora fragariae]|uniref:Uncharacterized protein n=2 Tax=Phytophthora TaxID=4783 RepID=A0A6A3YHI5_9STRA|nr:hypothetical protein PF003_g24062 [Phytophthora fragariae]KAE9031050.1 hypothetical protein PR002_g9727 [Phytophthora rubi]KAE8933576.1 hypothetical protein PF009_g16425 [Phytophthora fragariae]KAE9000989.1 hypothetical protein PF011_g13947 [Phytophthora fragariae]KAE9032219.1 hypothetical protein PR001_g10712 [Phytophthora rubi]
MESAVYSSPHWVFTARPGQSRILLCSSLLLENSMATSPRLSGKEMQSSSSSSLSSSSCLQVALVPPAAPRCVTPRCPN